MALNTKFILGDSTVDVVKINDETAVDKLPARIYTLGFAQLRGFYLSITKDQLQLPLKIYGNAYTRVEKCIQTYIARPMSTGILMTGDKGTGKTLLMSLIANQVINKLELPVILIRDAYEGDAFVSFIERIGECCLVFDEFGKMYDSGHGRNNDGPKQESLLSLMDGIDKTKRLIIMTENDEYDISEFIYNRPSRAYYHFRYKKLDEDSIIDYCTDFNVGERHIEDIVDLSRRSRIFSFDMLQSIVEEQLRFGFDISEIIEDLNIDIKQEMEVKMEIIKVIDIETDHEYPLAPKQDKIVRKPVYDYEYISYIDTLGLERSDECELPVCSDGSDSNKKDNVRSVHIHEDQLEYESAGHLVYETDHIRIVAKEIPVLQYNYMNLF